MSLIQDKFGGEFLRSGGAVDPGFGPSMLMFSHLPPVTSFTRLAGQSVVAELQPHDVILKKERDSPECGGGAMGGGVGLGGGVIEGGGGVVMAGVGDYVHAMGIKQEKGSEHDYRMPLYSGGVGNGGGGRGNGGGVEMMDMSLGNHHNLLMHDINLGNVNLQGRLGKEPSGRKGRRSNGDGPEGKPRRKRGESKSMMLDPEGGSLSPSSKPHICEHCNAAFRSSYHLRRHVLIHTGERPFRCSQCNMSFIQKYLLQRHEKIHSGEKPFSCDQCNMRFIQKYHMERHKRTHSGEKPYKCDTCQQYFSRTDRLLKHKRACGDGIKKGPEGAELEAGAEGHGGQGSYAITQGTAGTASRRRGKSKNPEGAERKRKRAAGQGAAAEGYGLHHFNTLGSHGVSLSSSASGGGEQVRAPKTSLKKGGGRKGTEKGGQAKTGGAEIGMDGMNLLQGPGTKAGSSGSNYDDAMQFLKKRRYLNAASNGGAAGGAPEYDVGAGHLQHLSNVVVQGTLSGVLDGDASLVLLDSSPLTADIKQDKSGIPDEVLQSLLDHYAHKPDVTFDLADAGLHHHHHHHHHHDPLGHEDDPGSPASGDKSVTMHEYSRFLLQALERTSHGNGGGIIGIAGGFSSSLGPFSGSGPLLSDKHGYASSPLEYSYVQPASSSSTSSSPPSLATSVPKSHFGLLGSSSPSHGFHLGALEPAVHSQSQQPQQQQQQQQHLTPSQELTEQLEKRHASPPQPHTPNAYQIGPASVDLPPQKDPKNGAGSGAAAVTVTVATGFSQDLAALDPLKSSSSSFQIENFAQAFGAQFKGGRRSIPFAGNADSGPEPDHRLQTPVSEFSGYSSLLADVGDSVSAGPKTSPSQSYN